MATRASGTYVYCLVVASRRPSLSGVPSGLAGTGRPRLLDLGGNRWLISADAPLDRYGEAAINRGLSDLEWVARAAVAHESVVESFITAPAVVPMKLFTIFTSDDRAVEHVRRDAPRIDAVLRRVTGHQEWGVRVVFDRARRKTKASLPAKSDRRADAGRSYLAVKKAQRDAAAELTQHARDTAADVYDGLAAHAAVAKRRAPGELPLSDGPLLLDAAFLVPARRAARFRAAAGRRARALAPHGYQLTLTGPWPPYTFIHD